MMSLGWTAVKPGRQESDPQIHSLVIIRFLSAKDYFYPMASNNQKMFLWRDNEKLMRVHQPA
jgi:hypothetical protein